MCKHGIPELVNTGGASVINLTSVVAIQATERRDCYTAAKGRSRPRRSMANWYAKDKVRVNAIAPGLTLTPRVQAMYDRTPSMQAFGLRHLMAPCTHYDIADMAVFLASDESSWITGQIMQVDSGVTIH
jgi:NAD(P)-dependent dehydrogenase (short-subunit alcohol dehydrogenase family)